MMSHQQPLISVLMTVFNAEAYLAASIESICKQTFPNWELILVDDASTDASLAIAKKYAIHDARIRLIQNTTNKGQTACLNQGLEEARGRWIARQDADDLSLPQRFEKQIERVTRNPEIALIGTCGMIINHQDCLTGLLDVPLRKEVIAWSLPFLNPFLHTSVLFQADAIRFLGGYDATYRIAQDYDLWSRVIAAGYDTENLSERLVCYRHLENSLSKANQEQALCEITEISQRAAQEIFREKLTLQEQEALQAWRFPQGRKSFWRLYHKLSSLLPQENILTLKDHARLTAAWHLSIAGRVPFYGMLAELGAAFIADPSFVITWGRERFGAF